MTLGEPIEATASVYFTVAIDRYHELGAFTACDGLGVEVQIEQREEGGNNQFVHQLPGGMRYSNVKLTRVLNKDSTKIGEWFASMNGGVQRATAEIVALSPDGQRLAEWHLDGVVPVRWTGPQLSVEATKVCVETLELAHHGFLKR